MIRPEYTYETETLWCPDCKEMSETVWSDEDRDDGYGARWTEFMQCCGRDPDGCEDEEPEEEDEN